MSIWGELVLTYVLSAYWLGTLIAGGTWLAATLLRGAGPAFVCWLWRAALLATALLPLIGVARTITGHPGVAIADGTDARAHWAWFALAVFCALSVAWRAARTFADWRAVTRRQRTLSAADLPLWAERVVGECAARFSGRPVTILAGAGEAAYTAAWMRPVLVLPERYFGPAEFAGMVSIVGHELAHVERRDYAWNLLLECVTTLVAFHPLVAWMKNFSHLAREQACDAMVVARLVPSVDYAADLLQFARISFGAAPPRQAMTVLEPNTLEFRLRALLSPAQSVSPRKFAMRLSAVALLLISLGQALPWPTLRVDFAPPPDVSPTAGRWTWPPPPPPPPPPPK